MQAVQHLRSPRTRLYATAIGRYHDDSALARGLYCCGRVSGNASAISQYIKRIGAVRLRREHSNHNDNEECGDVPGVEEKSQC